MRNKILCLLQIPVILALGLLMISSALALITRNPVARAGQQNDNPCSQNMFLCNSTQRCIPRSWLCDQEVDCQDGEDEKNCDNAQTQCKEDEYACQTTQRGVRVDPAHPWLAHLSGVGSIFSHTCIPIQWRCDGEADCLEKDDEENCQEVKCNPDQFKCKSFDNSAISCIPKEWVCDGQTDCLDMKDEANCTAKEEKNQCDMQTEFKCASGQCVYKSWRCDGDHDCQDGSDEVDCKEDTCGSVDKFKCKTTNFCIPTNWKCDGEPDCPDHSDETGCKLNELHPVHAINCSVTEFQCKNHAQCISKFWHCDGDEDCFDGSDEADCPKGKCRPGQKMCTNGRCLDEHLWCDNTEDCSDGSDERNCTVPLPPNNSTCDPLTEYACPDETPLRCIKLKQLCDGNRANDCTKSVCGTKISLCNKSGGYPNACNCRKLSTDGKGELCACAEGYETQAGVCTDINECDRLGTCDQICINKPGSYECDCYPGYKLTVGSKAERMDKKMAHKCRALGADPLLLLANRAAIRQYDIVTNKYHPLINKLESAVALDYWHANKTLVWSDVSKEQIVICAGIEGLGDQAMFDSINKICTDGSPNVLKISENVTTPDGLAIDWVHGLLFWTDTGTDTINVYDFTTKKRTVLIDKELDEPRAIAVDPSAGLIFWTDWGENARIERAGMDGKNRMVIVKGNAIRWPNGLAVDILDKRLYWADAKTKQISSCDYWGSGVRTILQSHQHLRHPFSLAVFEERLYWTDWDQEGVLSVNKFHGGDIKKLMSGVTGPMTVRVYHKQAQPKHENKCQHHDCEHICLPKALITSTSADQEIALRRLPYSCACENGFRIGNENASMCIQITDPIAAISGLAIKSIVEIKQGNGISMSTYLFGLLVVCAAFAAVYFYQQRRPRHFAALQFDNPIYRRTVEADLDTDMEHPGGDNSLGPIAILPIGGGERGPTSFTGHRPASTMLDPRSKLVLAVPVHEKNAKNNGTPLVNTNNQQEYGYEQP